jgi:iron complex outermembrane receptor protein
VLHSLGLHQEIGGYVFAQRRSMVHPIFQILDQEAENGGAEINYRHRGSIGGRENRLVAGLTWLKGANDEQRFVNVAGARGNLTADFEARAESWALYAEDQMELTPAVTLSIGARADSARRTFEDQLLGDGDRSDERTFSSVSPRLGVLYAMGAGAQWFANVSRSYEPPLLLELTSFGAPGFLDLDAQSTWQYEIGARGTRNTSHWEISVYQADIDDEIINLNVRPFPNAPFTVPSYRGVDRTRHRGVEAGFGTIVTRGLVRADDAVRVRAAYTWSDFRFVDDVQFGDNYLPGAAPHLVRAEARYETQRWWLAPNVDWSPAEFYADSANQVAVDPYAVLNVRAGFGWRQIETYAELSNVTDERYSASVQVDSATGRFFEPGQPRTFSIGLRWTGGSR